MSRDWIVDVGYAAAWRLVRLLPESVAAAGFRLAADMAWRRGGTGVQRLRRNLRRVVGPAVEEAELDRLTRQAMRSYARYWMEAFRLPSRSGRRLVDRFHVPRRDLLASAVEEGRGVILALPHAGNWDAAGAWVAASTGKLNQNVLPRPRALSTPTRPPISSARRRQMARPRPVPP